MNICIPVEMDNGLKSAVCAHFGSAPTFMIVDTETGTCRAIPNQNLHHGHGLCMPLQSLKGEVLDGLVVGGIGMGALSKLKAANLAVYQAEHPTVEAVVAAFKAGRLKRMEPGMACAHHGHGQGRGPQGHHCE